MKSWWQGSERKSMKTHFTSLSFNWSNKASREEQRWYYSTETAVFAPMHFVKSEQICVNNYSYYIDIHQSCMTIQEQVGTRHFKKKRFKNVLLSLRFFFFRSLKTSWCLKLFPPMKYIHLWFCFLLNSGNSGAKESISIKGLRKIQSYIHGYFQL